MTRLDVIRAWKDEEYRASLKDSELAMLPSHPAGAVELLPDDCASGGADQLSYPGLCTCIGICPNTADILCGVIELALTFPVCPPWMF